MKKYADDYEIVITEDEKGRERKKAVYRGRYYEVGNDTQSLQRFRRISLILLGALAVFHIAGGFVANRGMYYFFVALPYVFAFLPLYFLAAGILRLPKEKRQFRRDEIDLSFERVKKSSVYLLVLLGTGILGEAIFLIWFKPENILLEFYYLGLEVLAGLAVLGMIHLQKPINIQVIETPSSVV